MAVPESPSCEDTIPPIPPRRLSECGTKFKSNKKITCGYFTVKNKKKCSVLKIDKSCPAGQFLNLTSVECEDCAAGTYSLGGGIVYDQWENGLPSGFKVQVEKFRSMFSSIGRQYSSVNCSK